jgi:hypothetical protein
MPPTRPSEAILSCPTRPTVHTLPRRVVVALGAATSGLQFTGRPARVVDVIGLLVMVRSPTTPAAVVRLLVRPAPGLGGAASALPTGQHSGVLQASEHRLWMEMPLPVTHRLNLLVDLAHEARFRTTRRQVVSALAVHRLPKTRLALARAYDDYLQLTARDARIAGRPLAAVLDPASPKPGRRPMV